MLEMKKTQFFLSIVIVLSISLCPASILCETSCERAEELFQKSLRQTNFSDEKSILREDFRGSGQCQQVFKLSTFRGERSEFAFVDQSLDQATPES